MQILVFSKHLAALPLDQVGRRLRAMGVDGIDLTVRPGGHVDPTRVEEELPRAVETLRQEGVSVGMITTAITDAADPVTEKILRAARSQGITHYKLGYYMYAGYGTLRQQRADVAAKLRDLAAINGEVGIFGGYHNHSSKHFGASLWDIEHVLQGTDPRWLGLYLDPAHAVIEGGSRGWMMGMDLLSDRIGMLAVKDFRWDDNHGHYVGARRHGATWCPLEEGNTPWPEVLSLLRGSGFDGPISMHSEYQGRDSFIDMDVEQVLEQTERDLKVFRGWLAEAGWAQAK